MQMRNNVHKLAAVCIVLAVLALGLYSTYHYLWWFSPGYSAKQTAQTFFNDAAKGSDSKAYSLMTSDFQQNNPYSSFNAELIKLNGHKLTTTYSSYLKSSGWTVLTGQMKDISNNKTYNFDMKISDTTKTEQIGVLIITPKT